MKRKVINALSCITVIATVFALALPASAQGRRPGGSGSHGSGGHQSTSVQHSTPSRPSVDRSSSSSSSPRVDRSSSSSTPRAERPAATPRNDRNYSTSPRVDRSSTSTTVDRSTRGNMRPSGDNNRTSVGGNHGTGNNGGNRGGDRPGGVNPGGNKPSGIHSNPNAKANNSRPEVHNGDVNRSVTNGPARGGNNDRPGGDKPGGDKPGKPGGGNHNGGVNPGNGNHGGNNGSGYRPGDHGNRPGNGGYRPGDHGNRPGNGGYRPGNGPRPGHGGINHGGPRPNYDHYRWHSSFRPRHDRWYDYYRYNRWSWLYPIAPPHRQWRPRIVWYYRPIIPTGYVYYNSAPIISGVLGIEFGTYLDASLNYLYYNGYDIDGYQDNVVYLRNVNMMGYSWPDVMLQYDGNGGMCYAEFVTSASYQDDYRFRSLYNSLCNTFGRPINTGNGYYSWYGNNGSGFVNLNNVFENGRYFTILTFGV